MQVLVESIGNLGRRVTVTVPTENIETEVSNQLKKLARTVKIDGFRPGKTPVGIIERQYGTVAREEAIGQLMRSTLHTALQQEHLIPAGTPFIGTIKADKGKDLEYVATFEVYPEIKLVSLVDVEIQKVTATVQEKDVDKVLEDLRKQYATWESVERAAKDGDQLNIDYAGTIAGEKFEGGEAKNVKLLLGAGRMIAGFESSLIGAKTGEEKVIEATFPTDYRATHLAGKTAQFKVKINAVAEAKLPEINEKFANQLGVKKEGAAGLRQEVRATLERELEKALMAKLKKEVMDKLLELNSIDVPSALIETEAKYLQQQAAEQIRYYTQKKDLPETPIEMFLEQAKRRVSLSLLLTEIVKANKIILDQEKVKKKAEQLAASYENPAEVVQWYYNDKQRLSELQSVILEEQVVAKLLEQVKVVEKLVSYDEVMHAKEGLKSDAQIQSA